MPCLTPIVLKRERYDPVRGATNVVPCGKCPDCLRKRRSEWAFRLKMEQKKSLTSAFLTFTYDDDNLPVTNDGEVTLDRKHMQLFMKRLRKDIKNRSVQNEKIKYYTVGEYGTKTERPHYHSIMFNLPPLYLRRDLPHLARIWKNGHVDIEEVTPASINYVTGYCLKDEGKNKDQTRQPKFSNMSKGLGQVYLTDSIISYHKSKLKPYLVVEGGKKLPMPRFYKDKLFTPDEQLQVNREAKKHVLEFHGFDNERDFIQHIENQFRIKNRRIIKSRGKL